MKRSHLNLLALLVIGLGGAHLSQPLIAEAGQDRLATFACCEADDGDRCCGDNCSADEDSCSTGDN